MDREPGMKTGMDTGCEPDRHVGELSDRGMGAGDVRRAAVKVPQTGRRPEFNARPGPAAVPPEMTGKAQRGAHY